MIIHEKVIRITKLNQILKFNASTLGHGVEPLVSKVLQCNDIKYDEMKVGKKFHVRSEVNENKMHAHEAVAVKASKQTNIVVLLS